MYRGEKYRYHQAVTFDILTDLGPDFVAKFRIRLHITDLDGQPLGAQSANARRKALTRSWWNREWRDRHFALSSFLRDGEERVEIGDDDPLVLSGALLELQAPFGIDEEALPKGTARFAPSWGDTETGGSEEDDEGERGG